MPERLFLIIDGSNFYHRMRELHLVHLLSFDYGEFAQFLRRKNHTIAECCYYIGLVREDMHDEKSRTLMKNQQKLVSRLQKQGWKVKFGHMLKTNDIYLEKGVDVQIAVDVVAGAYEDHYDRVVLISSDTDLLPALEKVRAKGKKVTYIGFSHKPSHALIEHSDVRRLLTREDLEQFLPKQES